MYRDKITNILVYRYLESADEAKKGGEGPVLQSTLFRTLEKLPDGEVMRMKITAITKKSMITCLAGMMLFTLTDYLTGTERDNAPNWLPIANPPARAMHSLILDEINDRMVLFGGYGYHGYMNDVWSLSHDFGSGQPKWSIVGLDGPEPVPRRGHVSTYDPSRGVMYVFGGDVGNDVDENDVWSLNLTPHDESWQELTTYGTPPSPRRRSTIIYDRTNDRLIIFGGQTTTEWFGDLWELDLSTNQWTELHPSGTPPSARSGSGVVYIADSQEMWMFGGDLDPMQFFNDLWSLSLVKGQESWTELSPSGNLPDGRMIPVVGYDDIRERFIVHGGWAYVGYFIYYNDTWILDSDLHWNQLTTGNEIPARRNAKGACYIRPEKTFLVVFGGSWHPGLGNVTYFGDSNLLPIP